MDFSHQSTSATVDTAPTNAPVPSDVSSTAPSTTSRASTPATPVDTPLETQGDVIHNNGNDHEHDGALTPRKTMPHHGVMEDHSQLQKLHVKLLELEKRAERETAMRQQLEVKLQDEIIPIARSGFAKSQLDAPYFINALRDGGTHWEHAQRVGGFKSQADGSIGQITRFTIELLERELSYLRNELRAMTEVEQDRKRLQNAEGLWDQERVSLLEKHHKLELLLNETNPDQAKPTANPSMTDPLPPTDSTTEDATEEARHIEIPDLNLVRWIDFRLCLLKAPAESFAIDVLDGEPDISFERPFYYNMWGRTKKPETVRPRANMTKPSEKTQVRGQTPISERIRIKSKHILKVLSKIHDESLTADDDMPLVMTRPYKALDYWSEAIRAKFLQLESKFSPSGADPVSEGPQEVTSTIPSTIAIDTTQASESLPVPRVSTDKTTQNEPDDEGKEEYDEWTNSLTTYQHLKCLIQFMDEQLQGKARFLESDRCRTVAFTDIWYLFKPGDEVVDQTLRQVYRVIGITSPRHQVFPPWRAKWDKDVKAKEETPIYLHCVYIDFDGKHLGPMLRQVKIPRFDNEKTVTSLEVFPLRFAEDKASALTPNKSEEPRKSLRQRFIERGKLFMDMTEFKHMRYNGVTLNTRDEVDSNVVVDFREAFSYFQQAQKNSVENSSREEAEDSLEDKVQIRKVEDDWMPKLRNLIGMPLEPDFEDEDCTADCCGRPEEIYFKDGFAEKKRNQDYMQSLMPEGRDDPPPSIYPRRLADLKTQESPLTDGDYLIMSYRVFGFILRSRKWGEYDVS